MSNEKVEVMVEGGKATAGPAMGQAFGPLGVNIQEILAKINEKTADFKGMKVPVTVIVDTDDKSFDLEIGTPPVSELMKKELNIQKGSGLQKIKKSANMAIEQIIKVAKMKTDSMLSKDLKASVKTVVGSCGPMGIIVEGKQLNIILKEIDDGKYDDLINSGKTEVSEDKLKQLSSDLKSVNDSLEERYSKELAKIEEDKAADTAIAEEATEKEEPSS
ncbi:50S ribosomal protein L11 [Candidatus Woesearchaeota archaeon]|nr:50S ribosomal protein L11 [Candidatus Woesearchaeota archaeon]MBT4835433.1 50S ribosomal protein L11 [Candidatus Woesearchaeota archaeon]MBT6734875.1 50S ribosomal protein L11 [Candidatus Woesearchaeota archaeon]MBT7169610.1 50S ribosomal protein L11 [Candidatus Woesearchaeota archaeon]MBT7474568.1 50S ribosomal protein L11 [Candidatus Woesearchaeota archaeon]